MRVVAPVTDYIPGTLLNAQGDIIKRGASEAERLPLGSAGDVLTVNSAGDDLEYRTGGIINKVNENSQSNGGLVTVTTSMTTLSDRALPDITAGERYLVAGFVYGTKTTGSEWWMQLAKASGTANAQYMHNRVFLSISTYTSGTAIGYLYLIGVLRATGTGTYTVRLQAQCASGSLAVALDQAQVYVCKLANA